MAAQRRTFFQGVIRLAIMKQDILVWQQHRNLLRQPTRAISTNKATKENPDNKFYTTVSSNAMKPATAAPVSFSDPAYKAIDLSFSDCKEAYKSKTTRELLRALLVFSSCSVKPLVNHNKKLMKVTRRLLGGAMFRALMKATFYGHFVAGEDPERIKPCVHRNKLFGVKSILDYSVEKDISKEDAKKAEMESCVSDIQPENLADAVITELESLTKKASGTEVRYRAHEEFGDRREDVHSARTYFYEGEEACEENLDNFISEIDAVSGATSATGFAAIKITALGRPQLLLQLSEVLDRTKAFFDVYARQQSNGQGAISTRDFEKYLKTLDIGRKERKTWLSLLDHQQDGQIDMLEWHNLLEVNMSLGKLLRVPNLKTGRMEPIATAFTPAEEGEMKNMLNRLDQLLRHATEKDVRVMIDAEQTYFQVAINRLVMEMMRKFNKEKAIVFNTYQCYLKDAYNQLTLDLALSAREDFYFGAKLVRGAYMDQERKRANTIGYKDPINESFEATTAMYEKCLEEVMKQTQVRDKSKIGVMVASHNEDTIRYTIRKMQEYNIRSDDKVICFGQLLGMCDQVSFALGQAGFSVYKYVPYGPVEEVLPYLTRRAQENKGILFKVKKEKQLLRQEIWRRMRGGEFFYSPPTEQVRNPNVIVVPGSAGRGETVSHPR